MNDRSTPSFSDFDPTPIPFQAELLDDMRFRFDYSKGVQHILLSGSVGSAKSLIAAHCGWRHLVKFPRSRLLLGRKAKPDLRDTIYTKMLEHWEGTVKSDGSIVKEGVDFGFTDTQCKIWLSNGSEVISRSWADKRYKKLGSLEISAAIIEELAENDADDKQAIDFISMRVGRLPHVPENWIIYCTNPDSPTHFAYEMFEIGRVQNGLTPTKPNRYVYFSLTAKNPFLPPTYVQGLLDTLPPKLAERMVYGRWVEINSEVIYDCYSQANYRDEEYIVDPLRPIYVCFDFNIGQGKPMSACFTQVVMKGGKPEFHVFGESVVEGANTESQLENIAGMGLFDFEDCEYIVNGDATGASKTTKSNLSDYDIIKKFMANYRTPKGSRLEFSIQVPASNPAVRQRHNLVNGACKSASGKSRLFVYKGAPTVDKGLRLSSLKKGGQYVEDDSKPYQHVTTALGYHIWWVTRKTESTSGVRTVKAL